MQIKLSIILDTIRRYKTTENITPEYNPAFSSCLALPPRGTDLKEDCLYIGLLSEALKRTDDPNQHVIICLEDCEADLNRQKDACSGLIIVSGCPDFLALLSLVQERFYEVIRWKESMDNALLKDCSMQDLVELCPPLLSNYIQITDASFMKLAQTTAFDCDCPVCANLKKYGYHPEETVELFRKYHLFDVWAHLDNRLYYDEATVVSKYPTLHRVFKYHGNYYAHVVMTCSSEPVSQGMKDLFQIFIDELSVCIEREWEDKQSCVHPYDNFLLELLKGRIPDSRELEDRASRIGFALEGPFYVFEITRAEEQNVPLGTIMKDFSIEFPRVKFINSRSNIAALMQASEKSGQAPKVFCKKLEGFLEKHNCYCGISSGFDRLADSSSGFTQASLALKYGLEMRLKDKDAVTFPTLFENPGRMFAFDSYFPFCFLGGEKDLRELWHGSSYHNLLERLYQKDLLHGTDDLNLLITYILKERRNSEVAAALNMHRNTIIYKIRNIEDYLQIDLNDIHTRAMLAFACFAARYYGFKE